MAATFYQYSVSEKYLGSWMSLVGSDKKKMKMTQGEAMQNAVSTYNETCARILEGPCPAEQWVSEGSQWAVSRSRIKQHTWSYYQRLLELKAAGEEIHKK